MKDLKGGSSLVKTPKHIHGRNQLTLHLSKNGNLFSHHPFLKLSFHLWASYGHKGENKNETLNVTQDLHLPKWDENLPLLMFAPVQQLPSL